MQGKFPTLIHGDEAIWTIGEFVKHVFLVLLFVFVILIILILGKTSCETLTWLSPFRMQKSFNTKDTDFEYWSCFLRC